MLAHNVYFALKDPSEAAVGALLAACKKYLTSHPGIVFFACGKREQELSRPVNDRDFDVSLHIVFETRAAHDAYQDAPLHLTFVEENRDNWAKVRVFDSEVESTR
ncbi:MAG TPA: Dabb family protein [Isosphaeraceae bacterium]|nr:Dabb family protein [Isosphaeraceae bacterium]